MNDFLDANPSINESQGNFIGSQIITPSAEIISDHFDTSSPKQEHEYLHNHIFALPFFRHNFCAIFRHIE